MAIEHGVEQALNRVESPQKALEVILAQTPTVESLADNYYTDNALNQLIEVTDKIVRDYQVKHPGANTKSKELEDQAFVELGLEPVSNYIDHIIALGEQLRELDAFLSTELLHNQINEVFVPPDKQDTKFVGRSEEDFTKKEVIQRTKAILFILKNNFDVDLNNPEEFSIGTGVLHREMVRTISYSFIDLPQLNRMILVNDEEGNASFVFDSAILGASGFSKDELRDSLTKEELKMLRENHPNMGQRIVYSDNFLTNMIAAIQRPHTKSKSLAGKSGHTDYLRRGGRFDWQPVYTKGIDGFIEEAKKRGLYQLPAGKVNQIDPNFDAAFRGWLRKQPEFMRKQLRDMVYAPNNREDWVGVHKAGFPAFKEIAQRDNLIGLSASEIKRENASFLNEFINYINTQPKDQRKQLRDEILAPVPFFDWQPIREEGINGFIRVAKERGLLKMTPTEVKILDPGFVLQFSAWLKTQPEENHKDLYEKIYTRIGAYPKNF